MFDILKKTIKGVIEKVSKKEEEKDPSPKQQEPKKRVNLEEKAKPSIAKSVISTFTGKIKIEKQDISNLLDEFEIQLIEADVAFEVAQELKESLEKNLTGIEIEKSQLKSIVKTQIEKSILNMLPDPLEILSLIENKKEKPFIIIFFGPNGAGKTTAIAKIANYLKAQNKNVIVAASDTFRAAAIEQLSIHCERLSIPLIKGEYGQDPTSIAFNAISKAKSKGFDVVLIDTAGRLEVDTNLMRELEKIVRVTKPDLKLFITESIAGNSVYDMVQEYNQIVGIDAAILTKLDLDSKGGVAISLYKATKVPIALVSYGQKYDEIKKFNKQEIIELILSE